MPVDRETILRRDCLALTATVTPPLPDLDAIVGNGDRFRRRRQLRTGALSTVVLIALGASVLALPSPFHGRSASIVSAATPTGPTLPTVAQVDQAVRDALFPIAGTETRRDWQQGLRRYSDTLSETLAPGCAAPDTDSPHFNTFPDLVWFSEHGFITQGTTTLQAQTNSSGRCQSALAAIADPLRVGQQGDPQSLTSQFSMTIQTGDGALKVDTDPTVQTAHSTLGACAAAQGITASAEIDFFRLADSAGMRGKDGEATRLKAGQVYGSCMQPVVAARTALLAPLRDAWLAAHAAEVARVDAEVRASIDATITKTGIPWPQPSA
jgi:hypothetical protein